jgi:hypothetical protein
MPAPKNLLLDLAGGDKGLAQLLTSSLEELSQGGAGEQLQRIAREALAGHLDLRELATSDVYRAAFSMYLQRLQQWRDRIGEAQFERHALNAQSHVQT